MKVDKTDFNKSNNSKVDLIDFQGIHSSITTLNSQLNNISTLMKEFIMTMVSNKSIGEGALKNKRKTIFEQFKIIEKWISDTSTKLKWDEIEAKELGRSNISQKLFQ